jgi:hypothetical protein
MKANILFREQIMWSQNKVSIFREREAARMPARYSEAVQQPFLNGTVLYILYMKCRVRERTEPRAEIIEQEKPLVAYYVHSSSSSAL